MSAKVRASIQGVVDHIFSSRDLIKVLKGRDSSKKFGKVILLSFSDCNCCLSAGYMPSETHLDLDSLGIDSIAINKLASPKDAMVSFIYRLNLIDPSSLMGSPCTTRPPCDILIVGHVYVSNYIKYVTNFAPSLIYRVILQIDTSKSKFIDFLESTLNGASSLCSSSILENSSCLSVASSLMSSFSFASKELGDASRISTYKIKPYGGETIEITKPLMKEMTKYWSSTIGSSFKKAYYSSNTVWIVVEKNTIVTAEDDSRLFTLCNVTWVILN
ncbi:Hypothetical protein GLP15_1642 [Giardia lamblia P15]|uniref:Uncharacterized protein n=1 Tax=Giardia intestinalis (strain P15) TaxID=658858 RepID=E1EX50_GIAIA|nr:Hypothetical protein GLP15_1642 [Giardia lamblia P15]